MFKNIFFCVLFLFFIQCTVYAVDPTSGYYYAVPPFLQSSNNATIYMALDYSGSMGFKAYSGSYDNSTTYYGYYAPDKKYKCSSGNIIDAFYTPYQSGEAQSFKQCKDGYWYADSSGTYTGNQLNYYNMSRIDILRLILTGGGVTTPRCTDVGSCSDYDNQTACSANPLCSWTGQTYTTNCRQVCTKYNKWGRCTAYQTVCDNVTEYSCTNSNSCLNSYTTQSSCNGNSLCSWEAEKVKTEFGEKINYSDINGYNQTTGMVDGILQNIQNMNQRPKIGAVIFAGNLKTTVSPSDNYSTLISTINSTVATGGTNTKIAVDTIYGYFSKSSSYNYGGISVPCASNYMIVMSDGEWNTPDSTSKSDPLPTIINMWSGGYADLVNSLDGNQRVKTYSVAMFLSGSVSGTNAMKHFAIFGSYNDKDNNDLPCGYPSGGIPSGQTSLTYSVPSHCSEWDADGNGLPDTFFKGDQPDELRDNLYKLFQSILTEASSGTSISVLSERKTQGTVLAQAVFHPNKKDADGSVNWIGQLFTYWLYNTRSIQNIREDSNTNKILDVCSKAGSTDAILDFIVDNDTGDLRIEKFDSSCDNGSVKTDESGNPISLGTEYAIDNLKHLWSATNKLKDRDNNERKIFTVSNSNKLILFETSNKDNFKSFLGTDNYTSTSTTPFPGNTTIDNYTNYIRGTDLNGLRNRTTSVGTYKIGDIINSSPQIVQYDNYSLIFVGSNDGMLHAFRMGQTIRLGSSFQAAKLQSSITDSSDSALGQEEWAFIPKNALPYLRYLGDPNYTHMYTVDLTPYILELDTNYDFMVDKKILIGGMRFGGAVGCTEGSFIKPPTDTCPDTSSSSCVGLSSYFALDITDPLNPKFLWEFTDKYLGFTFSGPAYVTYRDSVSINKYIVFASGPTDYSGNSNQSLGIYVLKLNDDFTINTTYKITGDSRDGWTTKSAFSSANKAFGGKLFSRGIDIDGDGDTELLFLGTNENSGGVWQGNIYAIKLKGTDPSSDWVYEKVFNNGTSPITAKIEYMKCFDNHYIYFGTGRWFYKNDEMGQNANDHEKLYGINIGTCFDGNCNINNAKNETESCDELVKSNPSTWAWEQDLEASSTNYYKERLISDPALLPSGNIVFFATTEPSNNACSFGGRSRMWGLNCATGGSMFLGCNNSTTYVPSAFSNTIFLQLSKGNIETINKGSFTENSNKTTGWFVGVTPETPPIIPPSSGAGGRIIMWIER